jgi:hypothetical protein
VQHYKTDLMSCAQKSLFHIHTIPFWSEGVTDVHSAVQWSTCSVIYWCENIAQRLAVCVASFFGYGFFDLFDTVVHEHL